MQLNLQKPYIFHNILLLHKCLICILQNELFKLRYAARARGKRLILLEISKNCTKIYVSERIVFANLTYTYTYE